MDTDTPTAIDSTSMTMEIVRAVAAEKGADPLELTPPLHTAIDTEALNSLFKRTPEEVSGRVTFEYNGYTIQVTPDGTVDVEPIEATGEYSG